MSFRKNQPKNQPKQEDKAPDPEKSGWDSARQVAISPSANPENRLRDPDEVHKD